MSQPTDPKDYANNIEQTLRNRMYDFPACLHHLLELKNNDLSMFILMGTFIEAQYRRIDDEKQKSNDNSQALVTKITDLEVSNNTLREQLAIAEDRQRYLESVIEQKELKIASLLEDKEGAYNDQKQNMS